MDFTAGLGIESEPTEDEESAATSPSPPARIRMSFWTDFGASEIKWGSAIGTAYLENIKTVFEVPFADLMAGRSRTIAILMKGNTPKTRAPGRSNTAPGIRKNQ